nr:ZIP family metal transporter [Devosia sp. 1635]
MDGLLPVLGVALVAGLASPLGGFIATRIRPSSLFLSLAVGVAAGVLLGTFAFELVPSALERAPLALVAVCFAVGFALVYGLDLLVNHGALAGPEADQKPAVDAKQKRHNKGARKVTVIGAATSSEELIEGLAIGVSAAADMRVALIVGLAIVLDNISEGLSLGAIDAASGEEGAARKTLLWTSLIGVSLFVSAMVGWFLLKGLPEPVLGSLLGLGAGAMFYLTIGSLLPEAESHQFQQSAAIAIGLGFVLVMVLSNLETGAG